MDRIDEMCKMNPETPVQRKLSLLDSKMEEILNDDSMSDWDKMQAYSNVLREYLEFHKQERANPKEQVQVPNVMITPPVDPKPTQKKKKRSYPKQINTDSVECKQLTKDWISL